MYALTSGCRRKVRSRKRPSPGGTVSALPTRCSSADAPDTSGWYTGATEGRGVVPPGAHRGADLLRVVGERHGRQVGAVVAGVAALDRSEAGSFFTRGRVDRHQHGRDRLVRLGGGADLP